MLRKEKIGDSSGGVSVACCSNGGLRENTMDAGREPPPLCLGADPTGDNSEGGDAVSGGGVCHRGGVSEGVTLSGVALLDDSLLPLPESLFF